MSGMSFHNVNGTEYFVNGNKIIPVSQKNSKAYVDKLVRIIDDIIKTIDDPTKRDMAYENYEKILRKLYGLKAFVSFQINTALSPQAVQKFTEIKNILDELINILRETKDNPENIWIRLPATLKEKLNAIKQKLNEVKNEQIPIALTFKPSQEVIEQINQHLNAQQTTTQTKKRRSKVQQALTV